MRFTEKRQQEFSERFRESMITWKEFHEQGYLLIVACDKKEKFSVLEPHYLAAENHYKLLGEDKQFLINLLPPPPKDPHEVEPLEIQKARAQVYFIDRSRDIFMSQLMGIYRPWLREEHLRRGMEDVVETP